MEKYRVSQKCDTLYYIVGAIHESPENFIMVQR